MGTTTHASCLTAGPLGDTRSPCPHLCSTRCARTPSLGHAPELPLGLPHSLSPSPSPSLVCAHRRCRSLMAVAALTGHRQSACRGFHWFVWPRYLEPSQGKLWPQADVRWPRHARAPPLPPASSNGGCIDVLYSVPFLGRHDTARTWPGHYALPRARLVSAASAPCSPGATWPSSSVSAPPNTAVARHGHRRCPRASMFPSSRPSLLPMSNSSSFAL
jgi:hypothetical protein